MHERRNWLQLARFCVVGASGYAVNLVAFAVAFGGLGMHHLAAATTAFALAVTNNFWWNRRWTFRAREGHAGFQAARFATVSVSAFAVAATVLHALVDVLGVPAVAAQAVSIVVATPLNFLGNRIWSFSPALGKTSSSALREPATRVQTKLS